MAVRDDRSDVKQTTTGFRGPLMVQSLTSAKSKFLSLAKSKFLSLILYWVELMIAAKLLVSHLTIKTHLVAVIPPVVTVFLVLALPNILNYFI